MTNRTVLDFVPLLSAGACSADDQRELAELIDRFTALMKEAAALSIAIRAREKAKER